MLIDSGHEVFVFTAAFLCGQVICIVFDAFRAVRKNISHSVHTVNIHDIVFCAFAFYLVYYTFSITNNAVIRWYEIVALFIASMVYFLIESKYVLKVFTVVFSWIIRPVQIVSGKLYMFWNTFRTRVSGSVLSGIAGFSKKCIKNLHKPSKIH